PAHVLTDNHVLPVPRLTATNLLSRIDLIERGDIVLGVRRLRYRGVLTLLPGLLALGVDHQRPIHPHHLGTLVDLHIPQHPDHRPTGELRGLLLHRLQTGEAVQRVTRIDRPVPVPRPTRNERVNPTVTTTPQLLRQPVTTQRRVQHRRHDLRRHLTPPPRTRTITRISEQRVVIAIAVGEITDRLRRRRRDPLLVARGSPLPQRRTILSQIISTDLRRYSILEPAGLRFRGLCHIPCSLSLWGVSCSHQRGSPRPRSAIVLRWISAVPAPMVDARVARNPVTQRPRCTEWGSVGASVAGAPIRSTASSCNRFSNSVNISRPMEETGPGSEPASTVLRVRVLLRMMSRTSTSMAASCWRIRGSELRPSSRARE